MHRIHCWIGKLRRTLCGGSSRETLPALSAEMLQRWLAEGRSLQILDIRDDTAFREARLPGARHLPPDHLDRAVEMLDPGRATVVY